MDDLMQIRERLVETTARSKSNEKRLDEVEQEMKENRSLTEAIRELAVETKYMREDLNQVISRIGKLENKDATASEEKWEKFKWAVLVAVIGIISGFLAAQLGLK